MTYVCRYKYIQYKRKYIYSNIFVHVHACSICTALHGWCNYFVRSTQITVLYGFTYLQYTQIHACLLPIATSTVYMCIGTIHRDIANPVSCSHDSRSSGDMWRGWLIIRCWKWRIGCRREYTHRDILQ